MKIHSDILTFQQIIEAVPKGCYLASFDHSDGSSSLVNIEFQGSRKRKHGYVVRLSGSSPYNMQRLPDKAATWDEWGIFIARLFELDPHAICGQYESQEHFIEVTRQERDRIAKYFPANDRHRKTCTAPWVEEYDEAA